MGFGGVQFSVFLDTLAFLDFLEEERERGKRRERREEAREEERSKL